MDKKTDKMSYKLSNEDSDIIIERLTYPRFRAIVVLSSQDYQRLLSNRQFRIGLDGIVWIDKEPIQELYLSKDAGYYIQSNIELFKSCYSNKVVTEQS